MTKDFNYNKFLSIFNRSAMLSGEADFCHELIRLLVDIFAADSGGISIFLNEPWGPMPEKLPGQGLRNIGDYFFNVDSYNIFYYNERFSAVDPYSPRRYHLTNLKAQIITRSIYQLEQMAQAGEIEKEPVTDEFIEFLKKNDCYNTLLLFLKYTPRALAVISLNRSKRDELFTDDEIHKFYTIALPIANIFNLNAESNHMIAKMSLLTSVLEEEGLVFVDDNFQILSYNLQAQVICRRLDPCGTFKDIIKNLSEDMSLVNGNKKHIFTLDREKYTVRIIANQQCIEPVYLLTISLDLSARDFSEIGLGLLTNRESKIANLICKGFSNRKIAEELFISENTVKVHLKNIYGKLSVDNRTSLALKMMIHHHVEI